MIDKQTTAQVAKTFGITRSKVYRILYLCPVLRPVESTSTLKQYLWSADEIAALKAYLAQHPLRLRSKQVESAKVPIAYPQEPKPYMRSVYE